MSKLREIKALEGDLFAAGLPSENALKLIAALEAVEDGLAGLDEVFNGNNADDLAIRAIAATLRNLITEALA
ncbi:hypothetical protein [Arthrobacter sp. Z1-15]